MDADFAFVGGSVLAGSAPAHTSVAVAGDRIAAVGDISGFVGPRTVVADLRGRLLMPAFHDAHAHPVWGGLTALSCDLSKCADISGYRGAIAAYSEANPERTWIIGAGWSMSAFPMGTPHCRQLDDITADRPVFLRNCDHHGAWVNTATLRLAGIDRDTPDPPDGRIERDADGTPTGLLHEGAMALAARHLPAAGESDYVEALRYAQAHLHSLGVAGWQDAILGDYGGYRDPSPAYRTLAASGELTARVCGALWWDRTSDETQIAELIERRSRNQVGRFTTPMVKIMLDGVVENFTAAMGAPYRCGHGSGLSFVDFSRLPGYVAALSRAGFGVHFHAIGDAAVRAALDAISASIMDLGAWSAACRDPSLVVNFRELTTRLRTRHAVQPDHKSMIDANRGGGRHQVAHLQVVDPADIARFAELGVIANLQMLWACHEPQLDELAIPFLGGDRARWLYPFGDLARAGVQLAAGSDWPVSSADPWQAIHVAVNRSYVDRPPLLPEQRLDLATAILAYTAGSALANGCIDSGVIEPGKLADLVVLDRDPFAAPVNEIRDTRVVQTYVGGRLVHDAV